MHCTAFAHIFTLSSECAKSLQIDNVRHLSDCVRERFNCRIFLEHLHFFRNRIGYFRLFAVYVFTYVWKGQYIVMMTHFQSNFEARIQIVLWIIVKNINGIDSLENTIEHINIFSNILLWIHKFDSHTKYNNKKNTRGMFWWLPKVSWR